LGRPAYALDALRSVAAQVCGSPFEVLVLDNGCDSRVAESVRLAAQSASVPVVYVPVPAIGLHNARHEAARRANGDVLAYLDDDVIVERGWLAGLANIFSDPDVHLVGGRCLPLYEAAVPEWLEALWTRNEDGTCWCGPLTLIDLGGETRDIDPEPVWGANFAIRKETLIQTGGFHPDSLPWHLRRFRGDGESAVSATVKALGLRVSYCPTATVHHRVAHERLTEKYLERRMFLQGITDSYTASRAADGRPVPLMRPSRAMRSYRRFKSLALANARGMSPPTSWTSLRKRVQEAHDAGYAYHQKLLTDDARVRDWVLMAHYWDADLPEQELSPCGDAEDRAMQRRHER
jgi:glycosyltransferase involved in cell wall biosynthesis